LVLRRARRRIADFHCRRRRAAAGCAEARRCAPRGSASRDRRAAGRRPQIDPRPRGDVFSRILSALVAITTILGIPVGLYGYYASQQASRVDRTFEFYKDFRGDTLQRGFSLLVEQWNAKAAEVEALLAKDDQAGLGQLVVSLLQSDEAQTALAQLVLFFDETYS
jgi:hypothetical protein